MYEPYERPKKAKPYPGKRRQLSSAPVKLRRIDNPCRQLKDVQRAILRGVLWNVDLPSYMFGAVKGRSIGRHAQEHIHHQASVVVKMDINSYYPSITCRHVYFVWRHVLACSPPVARLLTELTTFEWHLPQGAPTSPVLANILLGAILPPIVSICELKGVTLSTWIDDLIFSGANACEMMELVRSTLAQRGFRISAEKRHVLRAKDEKIITGVRLGGKRTRAPYDKVHDVRAAIHRLQTGAVPDGEAKSYTANVIARLSHICTIDPSSGNKLRIRLAQASKLLAVPTRSHEPHP